MSLIEALFPKTIDWRAANSGIFFSLKGKPFPKKIPLLVIKGNSAIGLPYGIEKISPCLDL
jgi:hypothetical protein